MEAMETDATVASENYLSRLRNMSRYTVGVVLIVVVAFIWVAASEWIQWIFGDLNFDKPYFMTFFNTTGFCFWNFGFLCFRSWREVRWRNVDTLDEHSALAVSGEKRYSRVELIRCALLFCPLWFLANSLFNYSLATTSVASNTILSSTSSIWTLLLSRIILGQEVSAFKIGAVLLCIGGTVMVALADSDGYEDGHSIVGDIIALISAFFYAAYTTVLKWCLPDESKYHMGMVFGFVGLLNLLLMWPGLIVVDLLGIEAFEFPGLRILWPMALNSLIGTNLSDVLWAKSVILTSPLVATLGLSLTTPIAMIADFVLKGKHFSWLYVVGAVVVTAGFTLSNTGNMCVKSEGELVEGDERTTVN